MSLNAKLTSLADKYRSAFNTGDKFSINDMISGMDGLEAHNYVTGLAQDGNLVSWKDGVGSYSTDSNEKINNLDICRLIFDIGIEDKHNYSLQVSMKGQGTFRLYVWPVNYSDGEIHKTINLTTDWKIYEIDFPGDVVELGRTGAFIRVNSDHQSMNFQIKDIKLYKR